MDTLLQSIQNMGYEDGSLDSTMRSLALNNEYLIAQQAHLRALASAALLSPNPLPITLLVVILKHAMALLRRGAPS
jgi:hypothetical protein